MATLRELIIKISANSQSFQSEIARASRMGSDYYRTMQNGGRQAASASRETQRALSGVTSQLAETKNMAMGLAGAFAGAFATRNLIQFADTYNSLSARIKLATTDAIDFSQAQKGLMDISQRTGSAFADNAALFSRTSSSLREWGYGTQDILKLTDALSTGLQVSGASAEETSSLIVQLSQALGRGVLRGQDFNSVAQSGQRIMKALSDGLGVAQKDLKGMADTGQLTTDKIVPALISQVGKLKAEFDTMPNSVSAASTRVSNAFMEWVGGANQASGATANISGALDSVAKNIDGVATAGGALVAIGVARYFGGMVNGAASATSRLIQAAKSEVALAEAQVRGTQISTARARAAVYRAQKALEAARGTEAQAAAEVRLAATQARLNNNVVSRTAAQNNLNNVTSVGSRLLGGALGLVGGIPGLVMLGAGAWYYMYQQQEQARKSAREYASQIDVIREKTERMSLPETADNSDKTRASLDEQNRLISKQKDKVRELKEEVDGYQHILANPGPVVGGVMINHLMSIDTATKELASSNAELSVEQSRLNEMQVKAQGINQVLEGLEYRRVSLIRQQAAEQNKLYYSSVLMNGQYTEFNRLLSLGNNLLQSRQGMASSPMRIPNATLNDDQAKLLLQAKRQAELSKLSGEARVKQQAEFSLQDAGIKNSPEYADYRNQYISDQVDAYKNSESNKPKRGGGKSEEQKTRDSYARLIEQQKEQIALSGQSTELAKMKYQVSQGELASLSEVQKIEVLRNAQVLDHLNTVEKLKSLQEELLTPEEALLEKTRERIKLLKEAAPATQEYRDTMERISKASVQEAPKFSGLSPEVGGAAGELINIAGAEVELQKWHDKQIEMQNTLFVEKEINADQHAARLAEIEEASAQRRGEINSAYAAAAMGTISSMTGNMASMMESMGDKSSAAYKAIFLVSKASAIAQAMISTEVAAAKALEMGPILGIPAAALVRGLGYASIGMIAGQTLAGMAHDGIDNIPREGTWLLDRGERVVDARTNSDLKSFLNNSSGGGGSNINITVPVSVGGGIGAEDAKALSGLIKGKVMEVITNERRSGGLLNRG